jgi:hypothetical protein
MINSINTPWAISESHVERYGKTWAEIDFVFMPKISEELFRMDPLNVTMGTLHIAGHKIEMAYKDLLSYAKTIDTLSMNVYAERLPKGTTVPVSVKNKEFMLAKHELGKLADTIREACSSSMHGYMLGLYL